MQRKLTIIIFLFVSFSGLSQSFFWKIDGNCFIISREDLNEIMNADWVSYHDVSKLHVSAFKDSVFSVNSMEDPYIQRPIGHIFLSDQDLLTYFVETKCKPKVVNKKNNQTELTKKRVKAKISPLGCSIYILKIRTKKRKIIFNEKVVVGTCC